ILYNTSHPTLNKVTIASNIAGRFGFGSYTTIDYEDYNGLPLSITTSRPILTNCIVWNNDIDGWTWTMITPPWSLKNDVSVNYSNVQGGWEGVGNIDSDPFFNPNFTLQAESPCINAGTSYFQWVEEELYDYSGENDYNELDIIVSPDDVVVDMDLDQFEGAEPDMGADESSH
ncbi:MAG: hypothetical protein QF645_11940, partial [Planctomycetota bacterium]|nr:hypothetical protein [Planctomycetota bacterium]